MIDNTELCSGLLITGQMRVKPASFFSTTPGALRADFDFDRVEGMLLGLAIGDALGNTSESKSPQNRRQKYGEIRDYLPNQYANDLPKGVPSDDSQMAFWTLEQLLQEGGLIPDHLAARFCREQIFGIGRAVKKFVGNYKDLHLPWEKAGDQSAGNGALMRIAPILIPHLSQPSAALWADAALAAMVTHNDPASIAACVSFVNLLWELFRAGSIPQPGWWLDSYVAAASPIEGTPAYESRMPGINYCGPVWKFAQESIQQALEQKLSVVEACNHWGSGAYLLETIPSVLYILMLYGDDPEEAIIRAVNDTWDNDTTAAIVGAAVGALHGKRGLPARWIDGLLGRTGGQDDGKVFELIASARQVFWE
jgi:ADP-ribosyl-[dinitrogen reductase] hydrolase